MENSFLKIFIAGGSSPVGRRFTHLMFLIFFFTVFGGSFTWAEPFLAIQEGFKCSKCHVNMTGGGKRTDFANIYTQTRLGNRFIDWRKYVLSPGEELDEENPFRTDSTSSFFSGRLNDYIAVGGDFRFLYTNVSTPNTPSANEFNQRKQNIYLEVNLIPERVTFYQTFPGGGDSREIFGLLKGFPLDFMYIKVGQFFLPYGLRLQDDTAFIRSETGFTYGITNVGLEVGLEPGSWAFHLAVSNGTGSSKDDNVSKRVTTSVAFVQKHYRIGASYSGNKAQDETKTIIYGVHGGSQVGRIGLLFEADVITIENPDNSEEKKLAAIFEINYLISRGINLKNTYEYFDPSKAIKQNARERFSLVFEAFIAQFTQFRTGIRKNKGIPQSNAQNTDEMFLELHLFF